ncbi:MAG: lasso peptide biosynthesis B2 protein [Hyphomicrobiales bacterium]|nr:lasso peptide biosynthesis B2 protein [Hyphomicrobiales bacterium]
MTTPNPAQVRLDDEAAPRQELPLHHIWQRYLRRAFTLSVDDMRLLAEASLLLVAVRSGLRAGLFNRVHNWCTQYRPMASGDRWTDDGLQRLARLVAAAADCQPGDAACLPRSLVLGRMLNRRSVKAQIRFGVRHTDSRVEAHAWVESDAGPLDASGEAERFAPLRRPVPTPARKVSEQASEESLNA